MAVIDLTLRAKELFLIFPIEGINSNSNSAYLLVLQVKTYFVASSRAFFPPLLLPISKNLTKIIRGRGEVLPPFRKKNPMSFRVIQFWEKALYSRVPLTGGRLTGRPDIRPFICTVIESSDDPLTVQKGRLSGHFITVHFGRISSHQND